MGWSGVQGSSGAGQTRAGTTEGRGLRAGRVLSGPRDDGSRSAQGGEAMEDPVASEDRAFRPEEGNQSGGSSRGESGCPERHKMRSVNRLGDFRRRKPRKPGGWSSCGTGSTRRSGSSGWTSWCRATRSGRSRGRRQGAQEAGADEPLQPPAAVAGGDAHAALGAAVAAAYSWSADISDDDALRDLLENAAAAASSSSRSGALRTPACRARRRPGRRAPAAVPSARLTSRSPGVIQSRRPQQHVRAGSASREPVPTRMADG